uniref:NCMAP protein n=1 Tax=Steinernema glaseri TaxID=37863 RepID=A0A1I8A659_9BILA
MAQQNHDNASEVVPLTAFSVVAVLGAFAVAVALIFVLISIFITICRNLLKRQPRNTTTFRQLRQNRQFEERKKINYTCYPYFVQKEMCSVVREE